MRTDRPSITAAASGIGSRRRAASGGGLAPAFLAYGLFSVSDGSVKALGTRLSPFEVACFIGVFSAVVLPFTMSPGDRWAHILAMRRPVLTLFRSAISTLAGIFSILAFTHISFAEAYAVIFIAPVLALVLSVFALGELVGWRRWSSVAAGIAGVLIVTRPGFRDLGMGHLSAFIAAGCVAASIVSLRVMGSSERPSTIYAVLTLVSLLIVTPLMLLQGFVSPTAGEWALLGLSGLAAGLGQLMLMTATRRAPANQIAPAQYSQLGWAILYGGLFFAELPDIPTFLGLAFIVGSGLFLIQRRPKQAVPMSHPL
ncbi:MAG: DMT family transporter [Devosia sp.]|nr:DMT family transporter [Devosia sp.]